LFLAKDTEKISQNGKGPKSFNRCNMTDLILINTKVPFRLAEKDFDGPSFAVVL